jgi:protein Tex
MPLLEPNYIDEISTALELGKYQTEAVLSLTAEGSTVPFIARYRKEATGNLDEKEIRDILELQGKIEALYKAKVTAINGITEQGKLTPELEASIIACETLKAVEEIYKPYRLKRKTKAMIAIEKGFGVVAEYLRKNNAIQIPPELNKEYTEEEILDGVVEIIAAELVISPDLRHFVTSSIEKTGIVTSKKKSEKMLEKLDPTSKKQVYKFDTYSEFSRKVSLLKPYQILALNRGENLGILSVSLDVDEEVFDEFVREIIRTKPHEVYLRAITLGYKTLYESVENEIRGNLTELGELDAVGTFSQNLMSLLMTKPEYGKRILAIDPGFRTGCKIAILDTLGNPVTFDKIYLDSPREATEKLEKLVAKNPVDVIVVGNGTGSQETIELLGNCLSTIPTYVVSEAGVVGISIHSQSS